MARRYQSDEQYEIQFTTRQLALLFGGLVLVVAGVFVGGIVIGRGLSPGESAARAARRTPPPTAVAQAATPAAAATAGDAATPSLPGAGAAADEGGRAEGRRLQLPIPAGGAATGNRPAGNPSPTAPQAVSTSPVHLAAQAASGNTTSAPAPAASAPPGTTTPPAATAGPAPLPASTPDGPFTIQVGAFRDRSAAEAMVTRLTEKGQSDAYIEGTPAGIFRVRVGRYRSRDDARLVAASLQPDFQTLVTRR